MATTDGAEKTGGEEENEGSVVKVASEEALEGDDVGAVDPQGGLTKGSDVSAEVEGEREVAEAEREVTEVEVGAEVDAKREVAKVKVGAKVDAAGTKVTDDKLVWVR